MSQRRGPADHEIAAIEDLHVIRRREAGTHRSAGEEHLPGWRRRVIFIHRIVSSPAKPVREHHRPVAEIEQGRGYEAWPVVALVGKPLPRMAHEPSAEQRKNRNRRNGRHGEAASDEPHRANLSPAAPKSSGSRPNARSPFLHPPTSGCLRSTYVYMPSSADANSAAVNALSASSA